MIPALYVPPPLGSKLKETRGDGAAQLARRPTTLFLNQSSACANSSVSSLSLGHRSLGSLANRLTSGVSRRVVSLLASAGVSRRLVSSLASSFSTSLGKIDRWYLAIALRLDAKKPRPRSPLYSAKAH